MNILILAAFFLSLCITIISTPILIRIVTNMGIVDDPQKHKHPAIVHKKTTPRAGSISLFLGIWITAYFFLPVTPLTVSLFASSLLALIIGVIDDRYDISRYFRFGINILCALIVIASGVTIPFITNPFGGILHLDTNLFSFSIMSFSLTISYAQILTLIWIVWIMNMLNWSKGVDGQMPGIIAISAIVIGLVTLRFSVNEPQTILAIYFSFIIAGASLGFLVFNFYPAKIFPGYGATAMYLLLAVTAILSSAKLATAFLVMGVPMIDGMFTVVRRIAAGRSPFLHDNKHLHHLLLSRGFGQKKIAIIYWVLSAILGSIALSLSSRGKLFAIAMLIVIVGGSILFLHITLRKNDKSSL